MSEKKCENACVKSCCPTECAKAVGMSWDDVLANVNHAVRLLETQGPTAVNIVKGMLLGIKYASGRDMLGVYSVLQQEIVDIKALIAAIKEEFALN